MIQYNSYNKLLNILLELNAEHKEELGLAIPSTANEDKESSPAINLLTLSFINQCDKYANTLLFYAIWYKQANIVQLLIKYGAKCNWTNTKNETPLSLAISSDAELSIVKNLIEVGYSVITTSMISIVKEQLRVKQGAQQQQPEEEEEEGLGLEQQKAQSLGKGKLSQQQQQGEEEEEFEKKKKKKKKKNDYLLSSYYQQNKYKTSLHQQSKEIISQCNKIIGQYAKITSNTAEYILLSLEKLNLLAKGAELLQLSCIYNENKIVEKLLHYGFDPNWIGTFDSLCYKSHYPTFFYKKVKNDVYTQSSLYYAIFNNNYEIIQLLTTYQVILDDILMKNIRKDSSYSLLGLKIDQYIQEKKR